MDPAPSPTWKALSAEDLQDLGFEYCLSRSRVERFGGGDQSIAEYGAAGMCGKMLHALMDFYHTRATVPGETRGHRPTKGDLAWAIKQQSPRLPLDGGDLGQFLRGRPDKRLKHAEDRGDRFWFEVTWDAMELLLLGYPSNQKPAVSPKQRQVFEEIRSYFLGNTRGEYPTYFEPQRRTSRGPYTLDEILRGLGWFLRRVRSGDGTSRLVLVSGGAPFPFQNEPGPDGLNDFGRMLVQLMKAGTVVQLVYPETEQATSASKTAADFVACASPLLSNSKKLLSVSVPLRDLHTNPSGSRPLVAADFLNPAMCYFFVEFDLSNHRHPQPNIALYISRCYVDPEEKKYLPFGVIASKTELELFKVWLAAFVPFNKANS